ncbi:hypothetical protein Btru_041383 [Bulinus truncatus]|nr:hypothetical protein Btru_041383 [Bulinus truncatus]
MKCTCISCCYVCNGHFKYGLITSFVVLQERETLKPTPLTDVLGVNLTNCAEIKKSNERSAFKNKLEETTTVDGFKNWAPDLNELEPGFGQTYLMTCAMFGFNDLGKQLIIDGADVDKQNHEGVTALILACIYGEETLAKTLLTNNANVNMKDNRHMDALMWAVLISNETLTKMLLDYDADVHSKTPSGLNALHIVVEKGLTDIVTLLVEKNCDVSSKSKDGWTPLMKSAHLNHTMIAELLIEKGADVHEKNEEGNTALHISCLYQSSDCVDLLLEHGADVNCTNCQSMTPLMFASFNDNTSIVKKLKPKNANLKSLHDRCNLKRTAIFYAVFNNCQKVVHFFISENAETSIVDTFGFSPLVYACQKGFSEVAIKLLKYKKEKWYKDDEYPLCLHFAVTANNMQITVSLLNFLKDEKDKRLFSVICDPVKTLNVPLIVSAAMTGNTEMINLMLKYGAMVNSGHYMGKSALHICVIQNNIRGVISLVSKHNADVNIRDEFGNTPLIAASVKRNKEIVDFLILNKASKYLKNVLGISAMQLASFNGFCDIVECLYGDGYDLELTDEQGWTPLMLSIQNGDIQTFQFLLSKGAQVNATSALCATPLMIASGHGKVEIVSILIDNKVSLNAVDINGQTSLVHATKKGHRQVSEILLSNRAQVDKEDSFKRTPLMYAAQRGDVESVKLFIQHKADCSHQDLNSFTSLMICSEHGFTDCVKTLLQTKVNVDDGDLDGNTALHFSSLKGRIEVVDLLLLHGADPNKCTKTFGTTPLMLASAAGHLAVVQSLARCPRLELNLCDKIEGKSALIYAVQLNRLSVVKLLIESGADVNATSSSGLTALHMGTINGFNEIVDYLISRPDTNVNSESSDGNSPLLSSVMYSRHSMIKALINADCDLKKKNKLGEDALTISLNKKCLISLKIILESCKVSKHRKNDLIQRARNSGQSEIADCIENCNYCKTNKAANNTDKVSPSKTVNVIPASPQQVIDIISKTNPNSITSCEISSETLPTDVTCSLPLDTITTENTFRLNAGGANVNLTGKFQNLTIINYINSDKINMMIGDKNTLNEQIKSESTTDSNQMTQHN